MRRSMPCSSGEAQSPAICGYPAICRMLKAPHMAGGKKGKGALCMTRVSFMPFQDPRRERCGLCRQRLALAYLLLLRVGEEVAGEMELCDRCAQLLRDVFSEGGSGLDLVSEGG